MKLVYALLSAAALCIIQPRVGAALETLVDAPKLLRDRDFRAPVTRRQLDEYLSDPKFEMWDLTIWRNERLKGRNDYFAPDGAIFPELTHAQQLLILIGQLDGDIGNGGIGQLFFNQAPIVPAMQDALVEMGCLPAAKLIGAELDRLADTDFIPKWGEARAEFARIDDEAKEVREQSWAAFVEFADTMFSDESVNDRYFAMRDDMEECVRVYIRSHTQDLFELVGP